MKKKIKRDNHLVIYVASPKHLKTIKNAAAEHPLEPSVSGYMRPWIGEVCHLIENGVTSELIAAHREVINTFIQSLMDDK